jgi:geranylgeranyl pyrophosphate synthase
LLLALALEGLSAEPQNELLTLVNGNNDAQTVDRLARVRSLYTRAGVFEKASRLIEKHRERAEKIADEIEVEPFRALLYYLIDSVLDHTTATPPPVLTTIQ